MAKNYTAPTFTAIEFDVEDIIMTSIQTVAAPETKIGGNEAVALDATDINNLFSK